MLEVSSLRFDYPQKTVLRNIAFVVKEGELLHVQGHNGSGKTTLFRLLTGLLLPQGGSIVYAKTTSVCYIGHTLALYPQLTVEENCRFYSWKKKPQLLQQWGLESYRHTPCYQLSRGLQKRVSLLRLSLLEANFWLLDEPFVSLDEKTLLLLQEIIQEHRNKGGAVMLSSHQSLPASLTASKEFVLP